jgi:integrase
MPKQPRRPGLRVTSRPGTASLYVTGTVRGQSIRESAGTDDPAKAEEFRAAREAELYRGAVHGVQPIVTFAAAALAYLNHDKRTPATKVRVGKLIRYFGAKTACGDIRQAEIDRAGGVICRPGSTPATRLREVVAPAKAVLFFAARRGWCPVPIFERMKGSTARTSWFTPEEAEALISAASRHLAPLITFLFCTGARLNEALTLEWDRDVDLGNARCTFRQTKNGRDRIVELPPRAVAVLGCLPGREGAVFRNRRGAPYRATNDSATTAYGGQIKTAFASALKAAGIGRHLTPHHCRHSFATWHYSAHRDLMRLRDDGGWSTISQVERYAKLAPARIAGQVATFMGIGTTSAVDRRTA